MQSVSIVITTYTHLKNMSKNIKVTQKQLNMITEKVKSVEIINEEHQEGSYMSLKGLSKIKDIIDDLMNIIPEGVELDDWVEAKIIVASDDLQEVYEFLKHKNI